MSLWKVGGVAAGSNAAMNTRSEENRFVLEISTQAELPFAHLRQTRDAENLSGRGRVHRRIGLSQIDVIQVVKQLGPELRSDPLRDVKILAQGEIGVKEVRTEE